MDVEFLVQFMYIQPIHRSIVGKHIDDANVPPIGNGTPKESRGVAPIAITDSPVTIGGAIAEHCIPPWFEFGKNLVVYVPHLEKSCLKIYFLKIFSFIGMSRIVSRPMIRERYRDPGQNAFLVPAPPIPGNNGTVIAVTFTVIMTILDICGIIMNI